LTRDVDEDEEIYAARIGRTMWRVAKRRAQEIRDRGLVKTETCGVGQADAAENTVAPPMQRPDPTPTAAAASPKTLSEFLRALAAELAADDQDPDAS
jgi:hypothetical protein